MADVFEKRIRRAEQLTKEWPFASELLGIYTRIVTLQGQTFKGASGGFSEPRNEAGTLLFLLHMLEKQSPPALAARATEVKSWQEQRREQLLQDFWQRAGEAGDDPTLEFFARTALQPWASRLDPGYRPHAENEGRPQKRCPCCGQQPVVSVLREDKSADTVRRSLICSLCSLEWDFARVLCPGCMEERPEKLPRYTAQEIPWMRVEACDSCGKYIKSVDLTLNWEAEPVVDELASTPLDVIAHEHGYAKIAPNLAGI